MTRFSRLATSAALMAGLLLASPVAMAADPHGQGGGAHAGPAAGRGAMPPRGFRGVPPGYQGAAPRGGPGVAPRSSPGVGPGGGFGAPSPGRFALGRRGADLGRFNGHTFAGLSPRERGLWQGGAWRHVQHGGYLGWWWVVGDQWFYYPGPIYPYPWYIGTPYYYDYYDYYPAPGYYWYYCEDPPGYYPYVQVCYGPWEPVPPQY